MLDVERIQALSLDLDDTLWPVWPTIARAEQVLHAWLAAHAPATAALFADAPALRAIREEVGAARIDLKHDLSALRLESLRLALQRAGDDPALAQPAFGVFFAERQRVDFFDDALGALHALAARWPLVALSNGNADLQQVGIERFFRAHLTAKSFGVPKPDPRIFAAAAQAVGVPAAQVLHVGDDATLDALGALRAGMQAAWINRGDHPWPHADAPPQAEVTTLAALCALLGVSIEGGQAVTAPGAALPGPVPVRPAPA